MHLRTRGVALLSVTAVLAGGSLTTVGAASAATDREGLSSQLLGLPIIGDLLNGILGQLAGSTVATIQVLIADLTPTQIGDLLQSASGNDLTKLLQAAQNTGDLTGALETLSPAETAGLLNAANPTQLTLLLQGLTGDQLTGALSAAGLGDLLAPLTGGDLASVLGALSTTELQDALATLLPAELASVVDGLDPTQTAGLLSTADPTQLTRLLSALEATQLAVALGALNPAQLTTIAGSLTPAQITGLLGAGGSRSVITGLLGQATGLAGGTPAAAQVNSLIAQVTALLGGGLPADPTDLANLAGLLTTLNPLLATSGLNPALLTALLGAANGLLGGALAPVAAPLQGLVTQVTVLLTPVTGGGGGTPPAATPAAAMPATPPRPAVTAPRPAAVAPGAQFTAYRAAIGPLKLNRKRSNLKFNLTCAPSAPKGCLVKVSAKIAGRSVMRTMTLAIARGRSAPITVTLSRSTTRRLKSRGGSLRITAATASSSLPSTTRTLKVKRLKKVAR